RRQLLVTETDPICPPQHLVAERFERDRRRRAKPAEQLRRERQSPSSTGTREEGDRFLIAGGRERVQLADERGDRFVPRDRGELTGAARSRALHRLRQTIRVI